MLFGGKLFAGALLAGALFGPTEASEPPTIQEVVHHGGWAWLKYQQEQKQHLLSILEQDREFEEFLPILLMAIDDET